MRRRILVGVLLICIGAFSGLGQAPGDAWADTSSCNQVADDPTLVTCTCICEASSSFSGCQGLSKGTAAPTPNQCPDMLQGRRVISGGDALAVADPHNAASGTDARLLVYKAENNPDNSGIGLVDGTPVFTHNAQISCLARGVTSFPMQTRFAWLFDLPYDMVVTLQPSTDSSQTNSTCAATNSSAHNMNFIITSVNTGAPTVPLFTFEANPEWVQLAIDDFDYDGFDDIFYINRYGIEIFSAADPADPTKGLTQYRGMGTEDASGGQRAPINEPTTGDFNGDGLVDVAWIGGNFPNQTGTLSVFFATICPGSVANTICAGAKRFEIIVDPAAKLFPNISGATSTIVLDNASLTPTYCGVVASAKDLFQASPAAFRAGAVALGNYENNGANSRGGPIDELMVVYVSGPSPYCSVDVQYWSFSSPTQADSRWALQRGATAANLLPEVNIPKIIDFQLYAKSAYLDWYGPTEQAAIAATAMAAAPKNSQPQSIWRPMVAAVSGTGDNANPSVCTAQTTHIDEHGSIFWGLAVGRFSTSTTVNSQNPTACDDFTDASPGDCPYNPQMAVLLGVDNTSPAQPRTTLELYTIQAVAPSACLNHGAISGSSFLSSRSAVTDINGYANLLANSQRAGSMLQAGDALGNSVRVGNPTITRISEHTQPQMVVQAPPALIDYVQPSTQDSPTPAIVNFSHSKDFNTEVEFETATNDTSTTTRTTSHSTSFSESFGLEFRFDVPRIESLDVKTTESWSQFHEHTVSSQLSNYVSTALQEKVTVREDDEVWWTQTTFNVFHYPVVGQTVCPASLTCDVSDPTHPVCGGGVSPTTVTLTCTESGAGCQCLSANTSASLCPALPSDPTTRDCVGKSGAVCCTQLPQQLYMTLSGPEEVVQTSQDGAELEWYQPKHEPGQILSYPANVGLLEARLVSPQVLATMTAFSTGVNAASETISYSSSCDASQGVGTTTRHSFESDNSLTAGTPKIAEVAGENDTVSFSYGVSTAIVTGQRSVLLTDPDESETSSSRVMLGGALGSITESEIFLMNKVTRAAAVQTRRKCRDGEWARSGVID